MIHHNLPSLAKIYIFHIRQIKSRICPNATRTKFCLLDLDIAPIKSTGWLSSELKT